MKVAILGAPANQTKQLESWLRNDGHQPEFFKTGNNFFAALRRNDFELLLVDVVLPDLSGIDLIGWARHHFDWHVPIVAMMARDTCQSAAEALKAGADDYLVRPMREAEVQSRIMTAAMRYASDSNERADFGAYRLDTKTAKIRLHGESVNLTRKEFELAAYFFRHPDQLISHETLLNRIWKLQSDIDTRTVATHVSRIRKKLQLDGSHGCEILSLYGYGYRCLLNRADTASTPGSEAPQPTPPAAAPIALPGGASPLATLDTSLAPIDVACEPSLSLHEVRRPVDRYVANLLKERQDFEDQIRRLRDAFCEATLELRALKRQHGRRHHEVEAYADFSEDLA
ncbi:response regulator transcription factor [Burkholderia gladioli]|uniref:response regulator transcription factor n=1 Tax=Burkholderia gladioli TaxID=28095 RepID=UPI0034DAEE54